MTTHEAIDLTRSVHLTPLILKELSHLVAKDIVEVVNVAIEEEGANLLQALAELIKVPSPELLLLRSYNVTTRRVSTANATRMGIVSTSAQT
jgi:pantoate kinase